MSWVMILLVWVFAPFVELGIIVGLCVSNSRYKRQIQELERMRGLPVMFGRLPEAAKPWPVREAEPVREERLNGREKGAPSGECLPEQQEQESEECPPGREEQRKGEECAPGREEGRTDEAYMSVQHQGAKAEDCPPVWERMPETRECAAQGRMPETGECAAQGRMPETGACAFQGQMPAEGPSEAASHQTVQKSRPLSGGLGTVSLILGVIFIVLGGLIFATTTWHVLGNVSKTLLVMACAVVFFGASFMAEKVFAIHKTSNAFYILGTAFLFLTVLAAAYFRLLGPEFILDGENRWKVLWVGSVVMELSFFGGLKRFNDKIYTQASLWGVSVSLFFLARAFSIKWNGFVSIMMVYGLALVVLDEYLGSNVQGREGTLAQVLAEGFSWFAPLHFWFFGGIAGIRGLFAEGRMVVEGCTAGCGEFLDRFSIFTFNLPGLAAMAALVCGSCFLMRRKKSVAYSWTARAAVAELLLYGAGWIADDFIWRMAAVNVGFLLLGKVWDKDSVFWDICGCTALVVTLLNFYNDINGSLAGMILCLAAFGLYYVRFYLGSRQWPHLVAAACMLPFPLAAESRLGLTFDQLGLGVGAAIVVLGVSARCFHRIMEEDRSVQGCWRMDWFQILSVLTIWYMISVGDETWRFVYILIGAVYVLQYMVEESLKKPALSLSAGLLAAAMWQQPFVRWPDIVELEMSLLPAAGLTWALGAIWERNRWVRVMETVMYMICLFLLCTDAFFSGQVADALMLEGVCLAVFLWAQTKNNMLWVRVSGALILLVVLFMTRDFWLSISWWVYLMAAGIGLIAFAAVTEKKRR